jgi:hypothetical protein
MRSRAVLAASRTWTLACPSSALRMKQADVALSSTVAIPFYSSPSAYTMGGREVAA